MIGWQRMVSRMDSCWYAMLRYLFLDVAMSSLLLVGIFDGGDVYGEGVGTMFTVTNGDCGSRREIAGGEREGERYLDKSQDQEGGREHVYFYMPMGRSLPGFTDYYLSYLFSRNI